MGRTSTASRKPLRRTAYLDGIRGFAALMVYFLHHQLWAHEAQQAEMKLESAWGYRGQYYLACFPVLRNFFTGGHYAVAVFFVLSGYVLSTRPLALIHAGDDSQLLNNLSSALFRRWLRLYLPILATCFVVLCFWHVFGVLANYMPQKNFSAEVWNYYVEFKKYSLIFNTGGPIWFAYNPHTWSIPIEFKGSIVVYTALMAFAKCTRTARLRCEVGLIFYFLYIADGAYFALFVGGMLLCDLDLLAMKDELPTWITRFRSSGPVIFHILFVISIFLGGVPSFDRDIDSLRNSPGWYYLSFLKPQAVFDYKWFYNFWAAMFLVTAAARLPWLKHFFETRFCQYLGRISYMFYLVHGPIMTTLGDRLYAATGMSRDGHAMGVPGWTNRFPLPRNGPFGLELAYLVPHLILLPLTLWVAEVTTALIDDPSVKFCGWLYKRTISSPRAFAVPVEASSEAAELDNGRSSR
ncbi:hypothetical protein LTR85_011990 [Meristemomyces frigidus]|nr:hypothetical protein LTR85_011990 [Meristemomyces frigidus]